MPECKEYFSLAPLKAILVRLVFGVHSLVTIYRVVEAYQNTYYWLLLISLLGLLIETVITLVKRAGKEWTWFSPAIFCYLIAALPSIWLLEIQLSQLRVQPQNISSDGNQSNGIQLIESIGVNIPLDLAGWALAMEQALLFILILGRWFMPKGNITKNQLSQILLVYIGMAADIMELFEVFKEEQVAYSLYLTYPTLSLWTVALFQYTLVISTTKAKKTRYGDIGDEESVIVEEDSGFLARKCGLDSVNIDVLGIMTTIVMQDGPFLCYRLYLLVGLGVISQMMVFFTCKNLLVILLQLYRLIVIYCEKEDEKEDKFDIRSERRGSSIGNETNLSNLSSESQNPIVRQKQTNQNGSNAKERGKSKPHLKKNHNKVNPETANQTSNPRRSWENPQFQRNDNFDHPNAVSKVA